MEVYFLEMTTENASLTAEGSDKRWGSRCAGMVRLRLLQLKAAPDLATLAKLPQIRLVELSGNPSSHFVIPLPPSHRIVFEAVSVSGENLESSADPFLATAIRVLSIEEANGK